MSDVRVVSPRETVIEVDVHAVPGRPGVVTPGLRVLHDGAVDAAGAAASSAVEASGSAGAAASSATAAASSAATATSQASAAASSATEAATSATNAATSASAAQDAKRDAVSAAEAAGVAAADSALASGAAVAARGDAELFAGHAEASAEAAAGSAGDAADSAQAAADSALGAAGSASTAEQAAGLAAQHAGDAGMSAVSAASSATAAKTSETKAEAARDTTLAAAILELRGTGQPGSTTETNTAPVGTYYTDTDGTAGAWRWLKVAGGSGTRRWTVVRGDTGWRNIADLLPEEVTLGSTLGAFRLKRVGSRVICYGALQATRNLSSTTVIFLRGFPAGFVPVEKLVPLGTLRAGNMSIATPILLGNMQWVSSLSAVVTASAGAEISLRAEWETADPWPTTLPGTPA